MESENLIIVFNVNDLFDLLRGRTSKFDQFFRESLVLGLENLNSRSEDAELLSVAALDLDNLLDVDGVLGRRLGDVGGSLTLLDGSDVDDVLAISRVTDGRLTSVDEGLGLSVRRVISVGDDLADNLVGVGESDLVVRGALVDEGSLRSRRDCTS